MQEIKDVRKYWNQRAEEFHKLLKIAPITEKSLIGRVQNLMHILDPDSKVLDVGCGPGRFAKYFTSHAAYYLGVDISDKMIEYAKKENFDLKNAEFKILDWENEDLKVDTKFDLVFASMSGALNSEKALEKFMNFSKKYCVMERVFKNRNTLEYSAEEISGKKIVRRHSHNHTDYNIKLFSYLTKKGYVAEIIKQNSDFTNKLKFEDIEKEYDYIFEKLSEKERKIFLDRIKPQSEDEIIEVNHFVDRIAFIWEVK